MKHNGMNKKLTFKKVTVSNLELGKVLGGNVQLVNKLTNDYSECGTGPATIVPCMCPPTYDYSQCGTGYATLVPCLCKVEVAS